MEKKIIYSFLHMDTPGSIPIDIFELLIKCLFKNTFMSHEAFRRTEYKIYCIYVDHANFASQDVIVSMVQGAQLILFYLSWILSRWGSDGFFKV